VKKSWILIAAVLLVLLLLAVLKPADEGAPYDPYFAALNKELKAGGPGRPVLVLDLDRLDRNLDVLMKHIKPPKSYRVVTKSLPSVDLIRYIFAKTGTSKAMVFHQPFINELAKEVPEADLLLGKPMPVRAVATFYDRLGPDTAFDQSRQIQWLVDSHDRLVQYLGLARERGLKLRINVEIDVGMHRGGLAEPESLEPILRSIREDPEHLEFAGFMGYEAHVAHAPPLLSSLRRALEDVLERYQAFVDFGRERFPALFAGGLTFNGAGSKTYQLYGGDTLVNDLAVGSGLVKPIDFDVPMLADHRPAMFIATPILKKTTGTLIPFIEFLSPLITWWNPNRAHTFFIYGGRWMAKTVSPGGLKLNRIYGLSSNQQILNGSGRIEAGVDDYVFLRPTQSEAVMLQFGGLIVLRAGRIVGYWPTFGQET